MNGSAHVRDSGAIIHMCYGNRFMLWCVAVIPASEDVLLLVSLLGKGLYTQWFTLFVDRFG